MKASGCTAVMKWCLVIFNALIVCAGAIAIGLGAWGLASEYGANEMKALTGSELYRGAAIALIVGGSVMVFIALCGFLGAILENRILLGIYFVIVLLILILFVVAAAVAFAYRDELQDEIISQMNNTLLYDYKDNKINSSDNEATRVWDKIQANLHCCGVYGRVKNSTTSWRMWQSSSWYKAQDGDKLPVPTSCCIDTIEKDTCTMAVKNKNFTEAPTEIYYKGCYDQISDEIRQHILAIAGIAVAIVILMFLSILFAICLCAQIGRHKMDV